MNKQMCEVEEKLRVAGKALGRDQPESVMEPQEVKEEPGRGMQWRWEAQWQEFPQTVQAPHCAWGNPQLSEMAPWDDAKAFLASFEQVAEACRWPRGEWVARLMPALSGEAQQAFSLLEARDKEDYGKVKAAILRGDALRRETQRQHFRQFCCQELEDPRRMYSRLQELCCRWLKPERHTKEQILELLVLEQFLASLPVDVQGWIRAGGPDSCAQAVVLLEDFLLSRKEAEMGMWQEPLQEWALGPVDIKEEHLDTVQGDISKGPAERLQDTEQKIDGKVALPDDGKRTQLRMKNTHIGGNEPLETPRRGGGTTQEKVQVKAEVLEERCESNSRQGMEPLTGCKEPVEFRESPGATCSNPSEVDTDGGKASFSKYHGWNSLRSDLISEYSGKVCNEGPTLGEKIQPGSNLDKYHRSHEEEKNNDCPEFGVALHSNSLAKHQIIHTGEKTYKCHDCRKSFSQKSDLLKHQMIHKGKKPHQCHKCGKNFSQRLHLLTHQIIHRGKKVHQCPDCGKNFSWKSSLLRHEIIHTGEKPHKCLDCGKSYTRRSDLLEHEMIHTGKKSNHCSECGKNFSWRTDLLRHQKIHAGEKPQKCPDCGRRFPQRSDLLKHQEIHIGEKPHKCPDCGKSFSWKSALLRHEMLHTGEKPHKCPDCGKGYIQRSNLLTHQMIHTGKKPHQCPECGKRFSQRSHLLSHQMTHTGEKPHKCHECGKSYGRKSTLLRHQKIHTERNLTGVLWVRNEKQTVIVHQINR